MRVIKGLKIHPSVFTTMFPKKCVVKNCKSMCCEGGAWIDIKEKEKILKNKELFKKYLRKSSQDESAWFEEEHENDEFPSGRAVGINDLPKNFCILFEPEHGCVLQKAAIEQGKHEWAYKSFFCILFPLTIENGMLTIDEEMECLECSRPENQKIPIWQACEREIKYLLGNDFYKELEQMAAAKTL